MFSQREQKRILFTKKYNTDGLSRRYFNPGELEMYLNLLDSKQPKTVIEFGVNEGRTPLAALRNIPSIEEYVGIDVLRGYETIKEVQRNEVPDNPGHFVKDDPRFKLILAEQGSFDLIPEDLPMADVIFIDADHSRKGVCNDYALAIRRLKPNGLIIFHDDNALPVVEVTETLDEFENHRRDVDPHFIHVIGTWFCIQDWQGHELPVFEKNNLPEGSDAFPS